MLLISWPLPNVQAIVQLVIGAPRFVMVTLAWKPCCQSLTTWYCTLHEGPAAWATVPLLTPSTAAASAKNAATHESDLTRDNRAIIWFLLSFVVWLHRQARRRAWLPIRVDGSSTVTSDPAAPAEPSQRPYRTRAIRPCVRTLPRPRSVAPMAPSLSNPPTLPGRESTGPNRRPRPHPDGNPYRTIGAGRPAVKAPVRLGALSRGRRFADHELSGEHDPAGDLPLRAD